MLSYYSTPSSTLYFNYCLVILAVFVFQSKPSCSQHCGSLRSDSFMSDDLCYSYWNDLSNKKAGLIYVQNSKSDSATCLLASKRTSEGLKTLPKKCRDAAAALSCAAALLPCEYIPLEQVPWPRMIPVPRPPCNVVCRRMVEQCSDVDEVELPDCDAVDPSTGQKLFPDKYLEVTSGTLSVKVPCMNSSDEDIPNRFDCPEPLVFSNDKQYCATPCPAPLYTANQLAKRNLILGIIGCFSLLGSLFVAVTYILNPLLRRMPGLIVFWLALWATVYYVHMVMNLASAKDHPPYCNSHTEFGTLSNTYCGAQSFLLIAGGLGQAIWFFVVGANLLLLLQFNYSATKWHCILGLTVACGYPLLAWIIVAASGQIQGSFASCFIDDMWFQISVFLIPLATCTTLAGVIIVPLSFIIIKAKSGIAKASMRRQWMSAVRVVVYITFYFIALVLEISGDIWNYVHMGEITDGITNWVMCSISLGQHCREKNLLSLNYDYWLFSQCFGALSGVVILFCFGTSDESVRFWRAVLSGDLSSLYSSSSLHSSDRPLSTVIPRVNTNTQ